MNINQWLTYPKEHVVIFNTNKQFTVADLTLQVAFIQSRLVAENVTSCALYSNDTELFLAVLLACACTGVAVVLPANNTVDFVQAINTDWYVGDFEAAQEFDFVGFSGKPQLLSDSCQVDVFTSGSSGTPKRISRNTNQLLIEIETLQNAWGESVNGSLFVATVSHQHIYGLLFKVLWPLMSKNQLWQAVIPFEESIDDLQHRFPRLLLVSSPAFLKRIADDHNVNGQKLMVFSSGGVMSDEIQQHAELKLNCTITQVYGSSETGGIAHRKFDQQWQLMDFVQAKVVEDVLWVKSPFCYHDGWLCTHDSVEVSDQGFVLLGRIDRVVKIEEKRISLAQVEQHIMQLEYVLDTAVIAMESGRQYLAAAIVLNENGKQVLNSEGTVALKKRIKSLLRKNLEQLAIPRQLRFVEGGLENSQGKRVVIDLMRMFQ